MTSPRSSAFRKITSPCSCTGRNRHSGTACRPASDARLTPSPRRFRLDDIGERVLLRRGALNRLRKLGVENAVVRAIEKSEFLAAAAARAVVPKHRANPAIDGRLRDVLDVVALVVRELRRVRRAVLTHEHPDTLIDVRRLQLVELTGHEIFLTPIV